jgi:glycosyltransferase involved in cell wall biosynthesis
VLLDAFALVLETIPGAHLVIAGDSVMRPNGTRDPLRQTLEAHATRLGIAGSVHFLGVRDDVDSILADADVAALSSDFEGTPLFLFECMAHDAPLVATAVGGVPDVIDNGSSGILVPPRDPRALADGLAGLLADPDRRAALSAAARRRLDDFKIDVIAGRFADLYEELVGARMPRSTAAKPAVRSI